MHITTTPNRSKPTYTRQMMQAAREIKKAIKKPERRPNAKKPERKPNAKKPKNDALFENLSSITPLDIDGMLNAASFETIRMPDEMTLNILSNFDDYWWPFNNPPHAKRRVLLTSAGWCFANDQLQGPFLEVIIHNRVCSQFTFRMFCDRQSSRSHSAFTMNRIHSPKWVNGSLE